VPRLKDTDGGVCSSPILYEDTVIISGIGDHGLRALEKATGKVKWEQKTRDRNRRATPALIRIGDRLQLIHYAGGKFDLLAANDLDDGPDYTTPAVSEGRLFIKGKGYLWCIGKKEGK
jgi:outer membrane protein assembly factor BamB